MSKIDEALWRMDCLRASADAALARCDAARRDAGDPCWEGYEQRGTKKKDGETVPNCVEADSARADADQTVAAYVKQEYSAGRRPDLWVEGSAGIYYLVGGGKSLKSTPFMWKTKQEANDAKFKYLDQGRKYIVS